MNDDSKGVDSCEMNENKKEVEEEAMMFAVEQEFIMTKDTIESRKEKGDENEDIEKNVEKNEEENDENVECPIQTAQADAHIATKTELVEDSSFDPYDSGIYTWIKPFHV